MNRSYLVILIEILLVSCGVVDKTPSSVYLAGEIVNPTSKYVILYKDKQVIDSAVIGDNNRFKIQFNALEEGLYHFYHEPEYNYLYLQKGDSINLRLNTIAFDESLIFSGRGAELNNFLLELFLQKEDEDLKMDRLYDLDPETFDYEINQLRERKLQLLESLEEDITLSPRAVEIVKATIDYNVYIFKEKYPFFHRKNTGENELPKLPDNFYDYRKSLNLNNKDMNYFSPYYNFMKYHLGNLAYMECRTNCDNKEIYQRALHFNEHKIQLVNLLSVDKRLKDNLYRNIALEYLLKSQDKAQNINVFFKYFQKYSKENLHEEEIKKVYQNVMGLQPNLELPRIALNSFQGSSTDLRSITQNKNVVLYFWSPNYENLFFKIQQRVKFLENKYPNYTFIGISANNNSYQWKSLINESILNKQMQFQAEAVDQLQTQLVIDHPFKSIILKNGRIENAFANLLTSF